MWQNNEVDAAQLLTNIRESIRAETPDVFTPIPYATNFLFPLYAIEPLDDINVRKALAYAVDWDAAVAAAWENSRNDRVMTGILTPELACYKEGNWPDWGFDVEKAKAALAASKYGSADKLPKIRINTNGQSPNYIRMAEIMAEQWKTNLGITDVEIKPGPIDSFGQEADLVQVRRSSAGAIIPDPVSFLSSHYNSFMAKTSSDAVSGAVAAGSGISDDEVGAMLDELKLTKRDDPAFCEKVQAAEAKLLGNYYMFPMIWDKFEYLTKPWVKNFNANVDNNWYTLLDMYIVKH
jgi:ABC-type transport system substrate-binding protein